MTLGQTGLKGHFRFNSNYETAYGKTQLFNLDLSLKTIPQPITAEFIGNPNNPGFENLFGVLIVAAVLALLMWFICY